MGIQQNENREKREVISYLDEVSAYDNIKNTKFESIVSISAKKNEYIDGFEKEWTNLRKKYNVGEGVCLYFNQIKTLLKEPDKVDENIRTIFQDHNGDIDYELIHKFYIDVSELISKGNFILQATGIFTVGKDKSLPKYIGTNSLMYRLFREHLDRMAFYLINLTREDVEHRKKLIKGKKNNPEIRWYKSKIRYDGDEKLNFHDDLIDVFSQCRVTGTTHFKENTIKKVFGNLKFISKSEVAVNNIISHAGSEIVDFIALYVARDMFKDMYKEIMINDKCDSEEKVDDLIKNLNTISVPGFDPIYPIDYIYPKLYFTEGIGKYKIIKDYPY
ncbi:hypothetical protein G8S49_08180 [Clostridium botulinum C]|uniref:Uncharacterized protein n=2 Tax=Clostridium botulinum TaxID=1491 RepID=A0A9Q4TGC7_CLOBO|nr:hypothetical protein [Clostridium botulinum]KMJ93092.1 hypothetical protein CBCST_22560 [Clostridium botulinum C str. Stockholm]MCD3195248.1 hypothetical protein [Clostridium botulinum C]MCD3200587.1 hypothetical protein [Clostridium botulinum C]MCD3207084.1 hypothetical protein [Clostridium botulinum C]MCD3208434.1 hypothetical protein [Clostridium botulinum C]